MKTKLGSCFGLLAISLLAVGACSSVPRSIVPPEVQLVSLSLVRATPQGQTFRVGFLLRNPNDFPIPIQGLEFSARLSGEGLLIGESLAPATLPALGEERLRVEVQTDLVASMSRLIAVVQGPEEGLAYELAGRLRLDGRPPRSVPFAFNGLVPLSATMSTR